MGLRVSCVFALVLALMGSGVFLPAQALGVSASLEARAKAEKLGCAASGVSAADASTGTVLPGGSAPEPVDVYLATGERLTVELTAPAGSDFDLFLMWPGESDPVSFHVAAAAVTTSYPEVMTFDAAAPGTYRIAIVVISGSGAYTLDWDKSSASSAGNIQRMQGLNRYLTAVDVSQNVFSETPSRDVVLASGGSFPDSLTASGLAGTLGCPLLLTRVSDAPSYVVDEFGRLGVTDVHIVGGPAAVSPAVVTQLEQAGFDVFRYGGVDRYETAALVARAISALSSAPPEYVFVARGDVFADALVVSPLAYARAYPILLTKSSALSTYASQAIMDIEAEEVVIAGGTAAISGAVESSLQSIVGATHVSREGGADRYETAVRIAEMGIREYWATPEWTGLASGTNFPDAVCGGAGIGAEGGILVLTKPTSLPDDTAAFIARVTDDGLLDESVIFGGPAAIDPAVESELAEVISQWQS